jgi:hypothetical protein
MEQEIFLLKMLGYAVPKIYLDIFKKAEKKQQRRQ